MTDIHTLTPSENLRTRRRAARVIEEEILEIFDLVKITHQLMIHSDSETSPYAFDAERALIASICALRDKTAKFEACFYGDRS